MTECDDSMLAYVRYRLEKSLEVYKAACVLYDAAQWNSVINRLYYACFYSASALLLYKHIIAKSHSGVIGQFSENMVRTGIFSVDEFRVYAKLLNWRSKGDYNDFFDFSKEDVDSMMRPTKHFIDKVVALIELFNLCVVCENLQYKQNDSVVRDVVTRKQLLNNNIVICVNCLSVGNASLFYISFYSFETLNLCRGECSSKTRLLFNIAIANCTKKINILMQSVRDEVSVFFQYALAKTMIICDCNLFSD